jgi:hypothetical protein
MIIRVRYGNKSMMTALSDEEIMEELKNREPIFHHPDKWQI